MTRKQLFITGLAVYLAWLILALPATLLDGILDRQTAGSIRLAEATGTLWSGAAQLEFRETNGLAGIAQGVSWKFRPWLMLRGKTTFDITLDQSQKPFPVNIGLSQVTIDNAEIHLPAAALGLAAPKLRPFGLGGDMVVNIGSLAIAAGSAKGNATAEWRAATSTLTPVAPLGNYLLRFDSRSAPLMTVSTLSGPLHVDGRDAGRAFLLSITVEEPYREKLGPMLRLISVERGPGAYDLRIE